VGAVDDMIAIDDEWAKSKIKNAQEPAVRLSVTTVTTTGDKRNDDSVLQAGKAKEPPDRSPLCHVSGKDTS